MNILISSAGRQVYLINAFKEALNGLGKVFVADYNMHAESMKVADESFLAPAFQSNQYENWILSLCANKKIDLLITLNVDELLVLEKIRKKLNKLNCKLIGGNLENITYTYDKYLLANFCLNNGLDTPNTYFPDEKNKITNEDFPLIAKPRFGKGSKGISIIKDRVQLNDFLNNVEGQYIFQVFFDGQEYGLDIINDFDCNYKSTFVREKCQMKNGETFEAIIKGGVTWDKLGKKISGAILHQGIIDIDVIKYNGKNYIIDINHRFGGGYIFSHTAGANLAKVFLSWFTNRPVDINWLSPKVNTHIVREGLGCKVIENV